MKKFIGLFLAFICCFSLCATAFASASADNAGSFELVIPDGEPQYFDIPECADMLVEGLLPATEDSAVMPRVIPSTANIFEIEEFDIHPIVKVNGKNQYLDGHWVITPASYAPTTVRVDMNTENQQVLIDYAAQYGYEVIGWYLSGTIHMECYLPHWVSYRTYDHVNHGEKTLAKNIYKSTYRGTISTYALFPDDPTQDYTYGFEGNGDMTVYYSAGNTTRDLYPEFVMMATFRHS